MGQVAIEQLLYLIDEAFDGEDEHALLSNLRNVNEAGWSEPPPGGDRTIGHIVAHVAACKHMYDHYAFAEGTWTWLQPPFSDEALAERTRSMAGTVEWLKEGHRLWRDHVAELDDGELLKPRKTNWGDVFETRRLLAIMIEHDLYHAGEINHLRALRQGNDRWAWQLGQTP